MIQTLPLGHVLCWDYTPESTYKGTCGPTCFPGLASLCRMGLYMKVRIQYLGGKIKQSGPSGLLSSFSTLPYIFHPTRIRYDTTYPVQHSNRSYDPGVSRAPFILSINTIFLNPSKFNPVINPARRVPSKNLRQSFIGKWSSFYLLQPDRANLWGRMAYNGGSMPIWQNKFSRFIREG